MHNKHHAPPGAPEEPLRAPCEKERDEYLEGWKRAKADLINYKKDETARVARMVTMGNEMMMRDAIHVLDSFDLGLTSLKDTDPSYRGMLLIRTQLEDILKRHGLQRISVEKGEPFDPARHEAVGEIESPHPEGTVAEEIERGYAMGDKVLRAVRVLVSKGQAVADK